MADSPRATAADLPARLEAVGRSLGQREATHREALDRAHARAAKLRAEVAEALERFHAAVAASGAPHLRIELSESRLDDKHVRAVEFELSRGRHRALVIAKAKGEVTLVGPFKSGKTEGPCLSFPFDAEAELHDALADFLERFAEEATAP